MSAETNVRAWRRLERLAGLLARHGRMAGICGLLAATTGMASIAARRPLWFDEIFTWEIATLPTIPALLQALGPMDPSPPLHYLLVRAAQALCGTSPLATRLPALLCFALTLAVLHRLVRPYAGPILALAIAAALLVTPAAAYAAEARPYALLLACSATSLLAWRAATAGPRRLGLGALLAALTAALYAHFYAFLLFLPIAAGEAVRDWRRGRVDVAVWAVMAVAGALALPLLPLLAECLSLRTTFWAAPTPSRFAASLRMFTPIAVLALATLLIAAAVRRFVGGGAAHGPPPAAPLHEVVAAATLAALPCIAFALALSVTNAYDGRYVLPALVGALALLGYAAPRLPDRRDATATLLLAIVCLFAAAHLVQLARRARAHPPATVPLPQSLSAGAEPVVVADPFAFVQTVHAVPATRQRLVYLIADRSPRGIVESTPEVSVLGLSQLLSLRVEEFAAFVPRLHRFWVFDRNGRWTARLRQAGAEPVAASGDSPDGLQLWTR